LLLAVFSLLACTSRTPEILPEEGDVLDGCADLTDNDGDGLLDCADESCADAPICQDETDVDTDISDTDIVPCGSVAIDHSGSDTPKVGDQWTVFLLCDGANITSALVIHLDPAGFAGIDENVLTFAQVGTGTLKVQGGSERAQMQVVVD
jgi:hypothetical protein